MAKKGDFVFKCIRFANIYCDFSISFPHSSCNRVCTGGYKQVAAKGSCGQALQGQRSGLTAPGLGAELARTARDAGKTAHGGIFSWG